jgi:hypothetical protein
MKAMNNIKMSYEIIWSTSIAKDPRPTWRSCTNRAAARRGLRKTTLPGSPGLLATCLANFQLRSRHNFFSSQSRKSVSIVADLSDRPNKISPERSQAR